MKWILMAVLSAALALSLPAAGQDERPGRRPCPAEPAEGEAPAYTEIEVANGGKVAGVVKFEGKHEPKRWKVVKDRDFCGDTVADESLVVGADGGLRFVAVYLEDIKEGKALANTVKEVANKDCLYQPHVETFTVCDKVMITNHDPIFHNTHAYIGDAIFEPVKPREEDSLLTLSEDDYSRGYGAEPLTAITTLFNLGLPTKDFKPKKTLRDPGIITLKCDAGHTWMTGIVLVLPHPYHTVTAADGSYEIADIPAGDYTLVFWHEVLGEQRQKISVKPGAKAAADAVFKK